MPVSKQFALNFSEYYRKKNYGVVPEMTVEHVKRSVGKDFLIQTAPLNFNQMVSGDKLQQYVGVVCKLNTAVGMCQISKVNVDDVSNIMLEVDAQFFDHRTTAMDVDVLALRPVGLIGNISKVEKQFNLMGFVCYPNEDNV